MIGGALTSISLNCCHDAFWHWLKGYLIPRRKDHFCVFIFIRSTLNYGVIYYSRRTLKERVEEYEITILDYPIEHIAIKVIDLERLPRQATKLHTRNH